MQQVFTRWVKVKATANDLYHAYVHQSILTCLHKNIYYVSLPMMSSIRILMIISCVISAGRMNGSGGLKGVSEELNRLKIGFVKWSFLMRIHVNLVGQFTISGVFPASGLVHYVWFSFLRGSVRWDLGLSHSLPSHTHLLTNHVSFSDGHANRHFLLFKKNTL